MRKILFVLIVGLILTSMTFGSEGKLNVWVRDMHCNVVKRAAHLHVYNCHGIQVFGTNFQNGHAEVNIAPGCYIIKAGVYVPHHSNIYTDKTMVIVKCGKDSCVNLVLAEFVPPVIELPAIKMTCLGTTTLALVFNAFTANIEPGELDLAIDVMARAGRVDKEKLLEVVKDEIKMLEESMPKVNQEEQEEMNEYLNLLRKARSL
jgi:hypothetical protein